jgi:hypothetical protein
MRVFGDYVESERVVANEYVTQGLGHSRERQDRLQSNNQAAVDAITSRESAKADAEAKVFELTERRDKLQEQVRYCNPVEYSGEYLHMSSRVRTVLFQPKKIEPSPWLNSD